jgi:hypothetical protein
MKEIAVAFVCLLMLSTVMHAATFSIGESVTTNGVTNVRSSADGSLEGTQPTGASGTVVGGPITVPNNSTVWYDVNFATGFSGWVGGDMLVAKAGAPPPVPTTVLGTGTDQMLLLDEFGNLDVTWYGVSGYNFTQSKNNGASWLAPIVLPMFPSQQINPEGPSIAVESSGAIDVVFTCGPEQCPQGIGNPSVWLIRSVNNGATWSAPVQISLPPHPSGSGANEPVIATCGAGVTVVWQDDGVGADFTQVLPDIILTYVVGGVPGKPINLSNTPFSEGHPQIVVNRQSKVFATWVTDNGQGGGTATDSIVFAEIQNCGAK